MDPVKVQGVTDWPQPMKVKDVQSFIGFMNFYRRFIWNFSEIARPLHALTQESKDWSWGAAEQQAFDALKSTITSAPMLAFPSKSGLFRLECNTSNFATGAVLSQQQEDGLFHPIGFMSKSFSDTEWNYQIHDKEMLAIMRTLEEWRHFLEGSNQKFEIHTDHKNLSYFREAHKLNCRQAQWSLYLSRFDFVLTHKPGRQMGRPDALLRQADHLRGAEDKTDCTLLIPNKVPDRCWQVISIDMIRELPDSKGYNAVLMVVDRLSKRIHAVPTVTSLDSAGVTQLFLEHVWHHHGLPEEVISDCGPAFMSNFLCELAALLGVKLTPSTSYHLQTDGQTEHVNQEIEAYL